MWKIRKKLEIAASHKLKLTYESPCENIHGHNWIVYIWCKGDELNKDGMIVDFALMKQLIHKRLDHQNLNDIFMFNPTAENISKWICNEIETCYKVELYESENNYCCYEKEI